MVETGDLGEGPALLDLLFDEIVVVGKRRDLRLMGDAEHLAAARDLAQLESDLLGGGTGDTGVDLVEDQGVHRVGAG